MAAEVDDDQHARGPEPGSAPRGRRRVSRRTCRSSRRSSGGGAAPAASALPEVGALVGSAAFQRDAERANTHPPVLHAYDRWGNRIDEVEYDDAYHRIIAAAVGAGAHTSAWADPGAGANVDRAAAFFLFAQVEPGHACPVSMTHAAVPTLELAASGLRDEWMPRLLSRAYEPSLAPGKTSALVGMAMTEKQGGSDVRANTTRARAGRSRRRVGPRVPADRPQVVLQRADERRVPGARAGAGRAQLLLRAAGAARRVAERVPHPAPQGQARQPLERVERDRARRHERLARRRRGTRRRHDRADGHAHPPRLRHRHGGRHAAVGRRGGVARAAPQRVRVAPRRPARDGGGRRRPRARVRGRDAHGHAARPCLRRRRG